MDRDARWLEQERRLLARMEATRARADRALRLENAAWRVSRAASEAEDDAWQAYLAAKREQDEAKADYERHVQDQPGAESDEG